MAQKALTRCMTHTLSGTEVHAVCYLDWVLDGVPKCAT